jgi:hypothetical protein
LLVAVIAVTSFCSTPTWALEPTPGPDTAYVQELEAALFAYRGQYHRWPTTSVELQAFAEQTRRRLDLSIFSTLTLRRVSAQTLHVSYVAARPAQDRGEFALSVREVVGQRR